jgi:D-aminopeptidase
MRELDTLRLARRAEALIAPWNGAGPGCTIGLVHDGALLFQRSAGLASVELGQPIGNDTCFRIASVSKQFTCAAILLLEAEGRLALDDEIQAHLPDLPDFGARVTIAHCMHNASGIRDFLDLMRQGGMDLPQRCTPAETWGAITRQRSLNFAPGSRYTYSNSNFLILGRIVEAISGETLQDFLHRRIFAPLGMNRTRHASDVMEAIPGLATGYFPGAQGGFRRAGHGYPIGGEGGLVSCVADLALWDRNYTTGLVGGAALPMALMTQAPFTNGWMNLYARGLQLHEHRGIRRVEHGGLWPGYKTAFLRAPEPGFTVICIANTSTVDPARTATDLLDAAIAGLPGVHPVPKMPEAETLARLAGRYLDRENARTADLSVNDAGEPVVSVNGVPARLEPMADGRLGTGGSFLFTLRPPEDGNTLTVERDAGVTTTYHRVAPNGVLPEGLAGRYVSAEIGATWTIGAGEASELVLNVDGPRMKAGPWEILPVEDDIARIMVPGSLFNGWYDIRVLREQGGAVRGIEVNGGRAYGVVFSRA